MMLMPSYKTLAAKLNADARYFDQDQDGMETMQVVMIIAVAAIVLLFVRQQWGHISNWAGTLVGEITSWQG